MPATTLTVQKVLPTGLEVAFTAATDTDGDKAADPGDGKMFFRVKNGSGAPITVTIKGGKECSFGELHDSDPITVTNAEERDIGPFATTKDKHYIDATGFVTVICSDVTSVTIAALRL